MDRAETTPDEALYEDPKGAPRGAQENSKGQSKEDPKRASREGPKEAPREAPRSPRARHRRVSRGVLRWLEDGPQVASGDPREMPRQNLQRLRKGP